MSGFNQDDGDETPEWMKILQEDADVDDDIAQILRDANNDPTKVRDRLQQEQDGQIPIEDMVMQRTGVDKPVTVRFREVNPFRLWVWMEGYREFGLGERDMLNNIFRSWYMIAKVGGFNSMNLQCFHNSGTSDLSYFNYDSNTADEVLQAFAHSVDNVEIQDTWARCCVDLGTSDELALDVLINTILGLSQQFMGIRTLIIGGENEDWPVPATPAEDDLPQMTMDPMQIDGPKEEDDQYIPDEQNNKPHDMSQFSIIDRKNVCQKSSSVGNDEDFGGNPLDDAIRKLKEQSNGNF
eukprot:TRINITY_DN6904_c0_g1_i3.p1 TRINITY_DN6904_c0_g1~~TRINITY_DN6904_c0_g1_i3.p1  ORF type:complete len:319 (+),score=71.16 TRINITY_DN6904_c0_g1_i3:73-957(+)